MRWRLAVAACMLAATGCAVSVSEVTPLGGNLYMVGANARSGIQPDSEIMAAAVQKASAFCASLGKHVEISATQITGVQGISPRNADVRFSCN